MADIQIEVGLSEFTVRCEYCRTIEYLRHPRLVGGTELPVSVESVLDEHYRGSISFGNRACREQEAWRGGTWEVVGKITGSGCFTMTPNGPVVDATIHGEPDGTHWNSRRVKQLAAEEIARWPRFAGREWHVSPGESPTMTVTTKHGFAATISIASFELNRSGLQDDEIRERIFRYLSLIACSEQEGKA
jgi:hypothetical protein